MITYKQGDLMKASETYIAHGCNAQGVMGSGVAKAIRETYPEAYEAYKQYKETFNVLPMGYVLPVASKNKVILNCITQEFYGKDNKRYVSYDAVDECMQELNIYEEIAMPKIGAGLGGGDWSVIEAIINHRLNDRKVTVYYL